MKFPLFAIRSSHESPCSYLRVTDRCSCPGCRLSYIFRHQKTPTLFTAFDREKSDSVSCCRSLTNYHQPKGTTPSLTATPYCSSRLFADSANHTILQANKKNYISEIFRICSKSPLHKISRFLNILLGDQSHHFNFSK